MFLWRMVWPSLTEADLQEVRKLKSVAQVEQQRVVTEENYRKIKGRVVYDSHCA